MKSRPGSFKVFSCPAALFAALFAAGCSSGPDIKPPPPAPVSQTSAPGTQTAQLQASLAALDRSLVVLWQEQARMQQAVAMLDKARRGDGCDAEQVNLAHVQLQDASQQQSRQFTVVSNIMKVLHDQQKAAVRNAR